MRLTKKGQITIPIRVREQLGLKPGDEAELIVEENLASPQEITVRLRRRPINTTTRQRLIESLRGRVNSPMTTEQIMALMRKP